MVYSIEDSDMIQVETTPSRDVCETWNKHEKNMILWQLNMLIKKRVFLKEILIFEFWTQQGDAEMWAVTPGWDF